jgi:hypothetical protein
MAPGDHTEARNVPAFGEAELNNPGAVPGRTTSRPSGDSFALHRRVLITFFRGNWLHAASLPLGMAGWSLIKRSARLAHYRTSRFFPHQHAGKGSGSPAVAATDGLPAACDRTGDRPLRFHARALGFVGQNDEHATLTCNNPAPPTWIQAGILIRIDVQPPTGVVPVVQSQTAPQPLSPPTQVLPGVVPLPVHPRLDLPPPRRLRGGCRLTWSRAGMQCRKRSCMN